MGFRVPRAFDLGDWTWSEPEVEKPNATVYFSPCQLAQHAAQMTGFHDVNNMDVLDCQNL